ncbi:hypothetical protein [Silvimonas sp.]|uniref:hypothetical protein n=1 Tax=Silvimonas sp. TaxID=2650811 RepID=UPI002851A460|nr:hypothetical protein [Silvimonas sp.]MDR3427770.1 hypothetical protein [Silvimonas sp.]
MHSLTVSQTKEFVRHVAGRHRHPVMLWGSFGVGKSELMAQLARENADDMLVDIRLSQYDSVDLRGFPDVDATTGLTVWHAPSTLPVVGNAAFEQVEGNIWLFFDEANAATPAVSAVAYQITNDRRCGEHILLPNVIIVLAGNRESDKGVVNRQPLPLSNRLTHVEVVVSVDDFCKYHAAKGDLPPIAIAFYQFRKELLHTYDPAKPAKCVSTPRTATKAWTYWMDDDMPSAIKMAAMAGAIGEGPAMEAMAFADTWASLKDYMPRIYKDPDNVELPSKSELGLRYAVTMALSGDMSVKTVNVIHRFLTRLDPEFVIMAWQFATARDPKLFSTPEFIQVGKRYKAVFV